MSPGLTESGNEDESPTNALLPEGADFGDIPGPIHVEQIDKIPCRMVEDHMDKGEPADTVDDGISLGMIQCCISAQKI